MIRAFLAAELSTALRTAIGSFQDDLKRRLARECPKEVRIAWVTPGSIHLTLTFLGDIDEDLIERLRRAVTQRVASSAASVVPIERLGAFPRPQAPRVIWLGPEEAWERGEAGARLRATQRSIEQACAGLGFATDAKGFSPHLTLARVKADERQVGNALARSGVLERLVPLGTLEVQSVVLMKSELRSTGSIYTRLWEVSLGEREDR